MTVMKEIQPSATFMGKLKHGGDLLEEITEICRRENVRLGRIEALGAVQRARLAYYNQKTLDYQHFTIDEALEITKLVGNVSVKDGSPIVHAHITLADKDGKAFGGHLAPGTVIFACELVLEAFEGPAFERGFDAETGLPLWRL